MDRICVSCGHWFLHPAGEMCAQCLDICTSCGSSRWDKKSGLKTCVKCGRIPKWREPVQDTHRRCEVCEKDISNGTTLCNDCQTQILEVKRRKKLRETDSKQRRIILD